MKKLIISVLIFCTFAPLSTLAQNIPPTNETFQAQVLEILEEREMTRENGVQTTQQNILLEGKSGSFENREFTYYGISDIDVLNMSGNTFAPGDKVLVNWSQDIDGNDQFFILNYVRRGYRYLLAAIFAIAIILVGRKKGVRSLVSLVVTFFIIIKFIIPQIIAGNSPLLVALAGSIAILGLIIYITEGFNRKTHIALLSIAISLFVTFILAYIFVHLAKLTGFSSDEATYLATMPGSHIVDFRGLLLAAILIGTLGVLDDVILGQIETVDQIKERNPNLSDKKTIRSATKIGRTHLSSMVNTLFLTYAGASLPLLILFSVNPESAVTFHNALDNEAIATEVIRTLAGSIGLILAFPITTYLAVYFLKSNNK